MDSVCVNSPRYQGEAVVGRSRHFAAFSSRFQHFGAQRRTVDSYFTNGDDQFAVQGHECVEFLHDLRKRHEEKSHVTKLFPG